MKLLWTLARWVRPAIDTAEEPRRTRMVLEVLPVIFTGPLALIALIWLIAVTQISVITDHAALLAGVLAALVIMEAQSFTIFVELAQGEMIPISGTIGGIVAWGAALLFGPSVIWLSMLARFLWQGVTTWRSRHLQRPPSWQILSAFCQEIGGGAFAALAGLAIYRAAGGTYPFSSLELADWLPVVIASLVRLNCRWWSCCRWSWPLTGWANAA